jgi:hypothetical protein
MRKVSVIALAVMASVVLVASALAESATKDECVTKSKDAVQLFKEKGMSDDFNLQRLRISPNYFLPRT